MEFLYPPEDGEPQSFVNLTNWVHFLLTVTIRSITVAVKYGFYSDEHLFFFRNYILTSKLLSF